MPVVKTCCGCVPLQNGVIAIGLIEIIGCVYGFIESSVKNALIPVTVILATCAVALICGGIKVECHTFYNFQFISVISFLF